MRYVYIAQTLLNSSYAGFGLLGIALAQTLILHLLLYSIGKLSIEGQRKVLLVLKGHAALFDAFVKLGS